MGRVLPTPVPPTPPTNPAEFGRPYDFTRTTDPRDLARALEGSRINGVGETRVVTPDEQ